MTVIAHPPIAEGFGPSSRLRRALAWLTGTPDALVWLGLLVVMAGFVSLAIAWGHIASTLRPGLQMPWLVSAGLGGFGLIVCGLAAVAVAVKLRTNAVRLAQLDELHEIMAELRAALEGRP